MATTRKRWMTLSISVLASIVATATLALGNAPASSGAAVADTAIARGASLTNGNAQRLNGSASEAAVAVGAEARLAKARWHWSDQGGLINTAVSTVTYKGNLYVFTRGTDGHLWVNWWG